MTKINVDESPDELLSRARRIARFNNSVWPAEFSPDQIAALMAKGWKDEHRQAYFDNRRLISHAITEGWLSVRLEKCTKPGKVVKKYAHNHYDEFGRPIPIFEEQQETTTIRRYIGAPACANWLKSRGIKANEYITEWLRVCGINLSQWQTQQEKDAQQAESSKSVNRYQKARELCKAAIRKVWERDPSVTNTGDKNAMAYQPELKPFLNGDEKNGIPKREEKWIEDRAREVAEEIGRPITGGRPRDKSTRSR